LESSRVSFVELSSLLALFLSSLLALSSLLVLPSLPVLLALLPLVTALVVGAGLPEA
jgi:hypothetical protein